MFVDAGSKQQLSFARAAAIFWQCSRFHQTSHSGGALHDNFKPTFRCALAQQSGRPYQSFADAAFACAENVHKSSAVHSAARQIFREWSFDPAGKSRVQTVFSRPEYSSIGAQTTEYFKTQIPEPPLHRIWQE